MDVLIALNFLEFSDDEDRNIVNLNRRELRDNFNVLEMPANQFVANFRVAKYIFKMLLEKLESKCAPSYRSTYIRPDIKLATFLQFLATGSYQQTIGNEIFSSMCKATVCKIIAEYLNLFEDHICGDWINAMVVCDHKTYIMDVDASHPGANHDAFVWEQSYIDQKLKEEFESGRRNRWILGDAGYKLKPYLMTPFRNPSNDCERHYNNKHTSSRNVVERCFGVLKNRFRCIIGSRGLHYDPEKATKIINVCCAIHNMCIYYKCLAPENTIDSYANAEIDEVEEFEAEGAAAIRRNKAINL